MTNKEFRIGGSVYWMTGKKKITGQIVDIYKQNSATTSGSTRHSTGGLFLLIQTSDGKLVTKLDSDVESE
jgi:hypothetical protein